MSKGWIKWTDFVCCSKNCNLQIMSCWFCMNFFGGQCNAIAGLIFNGGIFRLVWWPGNRCKHWITIPGSNCLCNKWSQMRSQVVPKKHAVWISVYHMSRNTICLNACTDVIDKLAKAKVDVRPVCMTRHQRRGIATLPGMSFGSLGLPGSIASSTVNFWLRV